MATAPSGLTARAELIISGDLKVSLQEVDQLLRDLSGFEDFERVRDGLLDYRLVQQAEEIFRPAGG